MFVFLISILVFFSHLAQAQETIAVIHSYPPGEWFHGIQNALQKSSKERGMDLRFPATVFHAEYWLRRPAEEMEAERNRIVRKVRESGASAVVVCDDEAAEVFALELHRQALPVFFLGINRRLEDLSWWNQVKQRAAIVFEEYPVEQLLRSARRLAPEARKVRLVSSRNPTSQIIVDRILADWRAFPAHFPFSVSDVFQSDSWQAWKTYLSGLSKTARKKEWVWILVPYDVRDLHGVEVPLERIGRWMREELHAPSLGLSSVHPKMGVLLTVAISPAQLASATVAQLQAWRKGTPFSEVSPRVERHGQLHLNLETAKRLRLRIPQEVFSVSKIVAESRLEYGR